MKYKLTINDKEFDTTVEIVKSYKEIIHIEKVGDVYMVKITDFILNNIEDFEQIYIKKDLSKNEDHG